MKVEMLVNTGRFKPLTFTSVCMNFEASTWTALPSALLTPPSRVMFAAQLIKLQ